MTEYRLKPCPFCGCLDAQYMRQTGPRYVEDYTATYIIFCTNCLANIRRHFCELGKPEEECAAYVVNLWNTRKEG